MSQAILRQRKGQTALWLILLIVQLMLVGTATAVVYSKHKTRLLFIELQSLHKKRDALDNEWTKLLLEQSAWAADERIDRLARRDLHLLAPQAEKIIMVKS